VSESDALRVGDAVRRRLFDRLVVCCRYLAVIAYYCTVLHLWLERAVRLALERVRVVDYYQFWQRWIRPRLPLGCTTK